MSILSKVLLPSFVAITVYITINKFFPENVEVLYKDSDKSIRGGSQTRVLLAKQIAKKLLKDRAIKLALLSLFATAGIQYFQYEIEQLLVDDIFQHLCVKKVDGKLKIVCKIIQEHELNLHTKSMKTLIVANNISREEKIHLLKLKLDFIINGECVGKKRFLVMAILGAIITFTVSGVGGLALILEALYRLFQEGKISKALYKQLLKVLSKRSGVPVEHFLD
jgi:hypothetical protein